MKTKLNAELKHLSIELPFQDADRHKCCVRLLAGNFVLGSQLRRAGVKELVMNELE